MMAAHGLGVPSNKLGPVRHMFAWTNGGSTPHIDSLLDDEAVLTGRAFRLGVREVRHDASEVDIPTEDRSPCHGNLVR